MKELGLPNCTGFTYLCDAVELYTDGDNVSEVYKRIALRRGKSQAAVAKAVSLCTCAADSETAVKPKEIIAWAKERILFEYGE